MQVPQHDRGYLILRGEPRQNEQAMLARFRDKSRSIKAYIASSLGVNESKLSFPVPPSRNNRGFVTLLSTLVVVVFGSALAFSLVQRAGISASAAIILGQSFQARDYADTCAEEALRRISTGVSYSGSDSLSFDTGDCEFEVSVAGDVSTIESFGEEEDSMRRVRVIVHTNTIEGEEETTTEIVDADWEEVDDF